MINQDKLKIVMDLYRAGHIEIDKAIVLLGEDKQPETFQPIIPQPTNPWQNPWWTPLNPVITSCDSNGVTVEFKQPLKQ